MVAGGELGRLRVVQVEYAQDWLTTALETTGQKQAAWRTDPARSGPAGCLGDIGSHAFNIAAFVTGLGCEAVAADLSTFVPGRRLDDNVHMLLRFSGGARGMLWASQVAPGNDNTLRLRVYGDQARGWNGAGRAEPPECFRRSASRRGSPAAPARAPAIAAHASRLPAGHPEGYLEAFAQLYGDLAEQVRAEMEGRATEPAGVPGSRRAGWIAGNAPIIAAAIGSSERDGAWTAIDAGE